MEKHIAWWPATSSDAIMHLPFNNHAHIIKKKTYSVHWNENDKLGTELKFTSYFLIKNKIKFNLF